MESNAFPEKGWENYNRLESALREKEVPQDHYTWMWENAERINVTIDLMDTLQLRSHDFAEIGPGGVGLAALQKFQGGKLDAYDCVDWFRPVYDQFDIAWNYIDLNKMFQLPEEKYNVILLCEVIEHLANWPVEIFESLKIGLKPGGYLLVSTQNLHRLSNRLRMIRGKRLFADFTPESLVMGHIREYMPEEISQLMYKAGFKSCRTCFRCFPDLNAAAAIQSGYRVLCKLVPRLSNHFFCWGKKG